MTRPVRPTALKFLGAAQTVTGSRHLLCTARGRVLLDCGLFQGDKELRLRNWEPLPVHPGHIDDVILSHAHLDHIGYVPRLVRDGFQGRIWCTNATAELARIVLMDSAHIQEEDAAYANRKGFSKHHPALPLYTAQDVRNCLRHFHPVPDGHSFDVARGQVTARLHDAGHILGSAIIEADVAGHPPTRLVFSGDLGRPHSMLLPGPYVPTGVDVLILESTYGDRNRVAGDVYSHLGEVICRTVARGGTVVIPAFAIERTQDLMLMLTVLRTTGAIPDIPIFLDSPMAVEATAVFARHPESLAHEVRSMGPGLFKHGLLRFASTPKESKAINDVAGPKIIVASSGMAAGGRVLHHLVRTLPGTENSIVLVGYQVSGTRGRLLAAGGREVKIHGQMVPVRAEVTMLEGLSAHADQSELVGWVRAFDTPPGRIFLVHGEPDSMRTLAQLLTDSVHTTVSLPHPSEDVLL